MSEKEILESLGLYDKNLSESEKDFFISNFKFIPEIIKEIMIEFPLIRDKKICIESILSSIRYGFVEHPSIKRTIEIIDYVINREKRNNKLKQLFNERKIFNFSEFKKYS